MLRCPLPTRPQNPRQDEQRQSAHDQQSERDIDPTEADKEQWHSDVGRANHAFAKPIGIGIAAGNAPDCQVAQQRCTSWKRDGPERKLTQYSGAEFQADDVLT